MIQPLITRVPNTSESFVTIDQVVDDHSDSEPAFITVPGRAGFLTVVPESSGPLLALRRSEVGGQCRIKSVKFDNGDEHNRRNRLKVHPLNSAFNTSPSLPVTPYVPWEMACCRIYRGDGGWWGCLSHSPLTMGIVPHLLTLSAAKRSRRFQKAPINSAEVALNSKTCMRHFYCQFGRSPLNGAEWMDEWVDRVDGWMDEWVEWVVVLPRNANLASLYTLGRSMILSLAVHPVGQLFIRAISHLSR